MNVFLTSDISELGLDVGLIGEESAAGPVSDVFELSDIAHIVWPVSDATLHIGHAGTLAGVIGHVGAKGIGT